MGIEDKLGDFSPSIMIPSIPLTSLFLARLGETYLKGGHTDFQLEFTKGIETEWLVWLVISMGFVYYFLGLLLNSLSTALAMSFANGSRWGGRISQDAFDVLVPAVSVVLSFLVALIVELVFFSKGMLHGAVLLIVSLGLILSFTRVLLHICVSRQ
jgi:hypothetical protein